MYTRPPIPPSLRQCVALVATLCCVACDVGVLPPGVSTDDAFRVSHVCADSFQVVNRFIRTDGTKLPVAVMATWPKAGSRVPNQAKLQLQMNWAPNASTSSVAGFRVGAPAGVPIQVSAIPSVHSTGILLSPSFYTTNNGPAECAKTKIAMARLHAVIGLGVSGSIAPNADSVVIGKPITWAFIPASGSETVDVRINGKQVAASGSQVVDQDIVITAVGMLPQVTSPEIAPLIAQARALLSSDTPKAGAEKLLNDLIALLDHVDEATGDKLLNEFQAQAVPADVDVDVVLRLDSLLNNAVLKVAVPSQAALRSPSLDFPAERTTYFVAAGILTSQEKLAATARIVTTLIRDRAMLGENDLIRSFVSPTMTGLTKDVRGCIARVFSLTGIRERVNSFLAYCLPVYGGLLDSNDFIEASSQILKQWVGGVPTRETSLAFMDSLQRYREQGFHLLIDGHSQGTLIAREAITEMANRKTYQYNRDSTCIGVVAMAGPVSGNWPMPLAYFREFATEGDIVAASGGSQAVRIPTDLTRQRDSALASVSKLNFPLRLAINLMYGFQLHDLQGVYLGEAPPRDYMLASNEQIRRECETETLRSAVGNRITISKGEEFPIGLYFQNANWNGHPLPTTTVRVTSEHPDIAEMISAVTVVGREIGDANLIAKSGVRSSTVTVEVRPPPVLGIGGGYAGQWQITNPVVSGSLSVDLAEAGSVNRNGEPQVSGNVTYSYGGTNYTVPILDGKVALGGIFKTITFRMATPEFTNPNSWANVSLEIRGDGVLSGGAILYLESGLVRESRGWNVKRGP